MKHGEILQILILPRRFSVLLAHAKDGAKYAGKTTPTMIEGRHFYMNDDARDSCATSRMSRNYPAGILHADRVVLMALCWALKLLHWPC